MLFKRTRVRPSAGSSRPLGTGSLFFFLCLEARTNWPLCSEVMMLRGDALPVKVLDSVGFLRAKSRRCFCFRFRSLPRSATKGGEAIRSCDPAVLAGEESGC